jgi:hypothetical protein
MAKLWLDHSDGRYSVHELTDEEAAERDHFDVVRLPDTVWEAYLRHCDRDATWQTLWRSISNEQYLRRREKELMPLEDAEREIARLKEELARSERMAKYYEEDRNRLALEQRRDPKERLSEEHRETAWNAWRHANHAHQRLYVEDPRTTFDAWWSQHSNPEPQHYADEFTCVFPKPGCDVEILPPEWRDRAREILAKYKSEDAAEGIVHQGCCCGHAHRKLDEATAQQLRNGGFLVENDFSPEYES